MKQIHYLLLSFVCMGGVIPQAALSNTVVIENSSGESVELGIDADDRFLDVLNRIQSYFQQDAFATEEQEGNGLENIAGVYLNSPQWSLVISHAGLTARSKSIIRDYHAPIRPQDERDIEYIVTTLAKKGALEIWDEETKLKEAGDRIAAIHPLNFLYVIFSNDKLIAGVEEIKTRKVPKLKSKFFGGITDTLEEEADRKNLIEFSDDFCERLKIKSKKSKEALRQLLVNRDFKGFVDKLIELKPREGADRHNM